MMKGTRSLSIRPDRVPLHVNRLRYHPSKEFVKWRSRRHLQLRMQRFQAKDSGDDDDDLDFLLDGSSADFDDLVLDDKFYEEIGEDKEMLEKYPPWAPEQTDPRGYNMTFEDYLANRKDIPDYIKSDLRNAQYFGPPILLLAGFHLEELPMMRLAVDKILGEHVKVLPVYGTEVLNMTVEEALELPEPDWSEPRPSTWKRDGSWGSRRTIVFSGLPMESQAAVVEVIEESGLPPVCCTIASEETRNMKLGNLLADAIKLQRDRKNPEKNVWEMDDRMVDDITDLPGYYADSLVKRVKTVHDGLQSGKAVLEEDEKTGILNVKMDGLKEEIFDVEEISRPAVPRKQRNEPPKQHRDPQKTPSSSTAGTEKKSRTKPDPSVVDRDVDISRCLADDESNEEDAQMNGVGSFSLSDFSAVDDLICDELGMEKPQKPKIPSVSIPPPYKPPKKKKKESGTPSTGNVYPISTEPESIGRGVKRSTVFSGLVNDADAFMKENFGYDMKKEGDITPATTEEETTTFDIQSLAEQEALNFGDETEDKTSPTETQEHSLSVEDVIESAIDKGVDPTELKRLIESLPSAKSTQRAELRRRLRHRHYK